MTSSWIRRCWGLFFFFLFTTWQFVTSLWQNVLMTSSLMTSSVRSSPLVILCFHRRRKGQNASVCSSSSSSVAAMFQSWCVSVCTCVCVCVSCVNSVDFVRYRWVCDLFCTQDKKRKWDFYKSLWLAPVTLYQCNKVLWLAKSQTAFSLLWMTSPVTCPLLLRRPADGRKKNDLFQYIVKIKKIIYSFWT